MSGNLRIEKVISTLPSQLEPNTLYFVRVGEGIDIYVTDSTGTAAHKHNTGNASGPTLPIFDDNIPVAYWNIIGNSAMLPLSFNNNIGDITVNGNYTTGTASGEGVLNTDKVDLSNINSTFSFNNDVGLGEGFIYYLSQNSYNGLNELMDDINDISTDVAVFAISKSDEDVYMVQCRSPTCEAIFALQTNTITFAVDSNNNLTINDRTIDSADSFAGEFNLSMDSYYTGIIMDSQVSQLPQSINFDLSQSLVISYTEMPPPNTNMICVIENTAIYNNNTYIKDDIYLIGNTIDDIQPIIKPPPAVIPNAFNIGENISITPKIVVGSNPIIDNRFIVPLYYSNVLEYLNVGSANIKLDISSINKASSYVRLYFTNKKLNFSYNANIDIDSSIFYIELYCNSTKNVYLNINGDGYQLPSNGTSISLYGNSISTSSILSIQLYPERVILLNNTFNLTGIDTTNMYLIGYNDINMPLDITATIPNLILKNNIKVGDTVSCTYSGIYNNKIIGKNTIGKIDNNLVYNPLTLSSNESALSIKPSFKGIHTMISGSAMKSKYMPGDIVLYKDLNINTYSLRYVNANKEITPFSNNTVSPQDIKYQFNTTSPNNDEILTQNITLSTILDKIAKYGGINNTSTWSYSIFVVDSYNTASTISNTESLAPYITFNKKSGSLFPVVPSTVLPGYYTKLKINAEHCLTSSVYNLSTTLLISNITFDANFNNNDCLLIGMSNIYSNYNNILSISGDTIINNVGNTISTLSSFNGFAIFSSGIYTITNGLVSSKTIIYGITSATVNYNSYSLFLRINNTITSYNVPLPINATTLYYNIGGAGDFTYNLKVGGNTGNLYIDNSFLTKTTDTTYYATNLNDYNIPSFGMMYDYINRANEITSYGVPYTPLLNPLSYRSGLTSSNSYGYHALFDQFALYSYSTNYTLTYDKKYSYVKTSSSLSTFLFTNILKHFADPYLSLANDDPIKSYVSSCNFEFLLNPQITDDLRIAIGGLNLVFTAESSNLYCRTTLNDVTSTVGSTTLSSLGTSAVITVTVKTNTQGPIGKRDLLVKANNTTLINVSGYTDNTVIRFDNISFKYPINMTIGFNATNSYIKHSYTKTINVYNKLVKERSDYINSLTQVTKQITGLSALDNAIITASSLTDNKFELLFDIKFKDDSSTSPVYLFGTTIRIRKANDPFNNLVRISHNNQAQSFDIYGTLTDGYFNVNSLKFTYIKLSNYFYYYKIEDLKTKQYLENVVSGSINHLAITGIHTLINYAYYEFGPSSAISLQSTNNASINHERLVDFNIGANTPINSSDSLNTAIGKAQGQINALKTNWVDYTEVFKDNTLLGITASALISGSTVKLQFAKVNGMLWVKGCITTGATDMDANTAYAQLNDSYKVIAYKAGMTIQSTTNNAIQLDDDSTYKIGIHSADALVTEAQVSSVIQSFRLGSGTIPAEKVVTIYGCIGELINKG